jgi:hypothetical protein
MKKRLLKVIGYSALTILMVAAFTQVWVSAQGDTGQGLVGSWDVTVTPRDCATGNPAPFPPPFYGLQTYHQGGTMTESDPGNLGAPTTNVGGQGVWSHLRAREYSVAFRIARFNPDGSAAGKDVIRDVISLGWGGNTYTSTGTIEIFNPAGIRVFVGCATTTGTRFE